MPSSSPSLVSLLTFLLLKFTRLTYPHLVVFGEGYGWDDGRVGLTFLSVIIGLLLALFFTPQLEKDYLRRCAERGGKGEPEDRLIGMMMAAPFVPICKSSAIVPYANILLIFLSDSSFHLRVDESSLCYAWRWQLGWPLHFWNSLRLWQCVSTCHSCSNFPQPLMCHLPYSGYHLLFRQRLPH